MSDNEKPARPRSQLEYPFETRPELGETIEVIPGVYWIRMRLPMQLNHINLWVLEDGDGWTIVDTGMRDDSTMQGWELLFAGPMKGRPVRRIIVTHFHPDHIGLAGWLGRRFGIDLWITRTDYLTCRNLVADTGKEPPEEALRFFYAAGFPPDQLESYKMRFGDFGRGIYRLPNAFRRIQEGESIAIGDRVWEVVVGRGHAPEHACLWCREANLFISGDQILPRISSNVSLFPTEPEGNPLQEWLDSCARLRDLLPSDILVLPAHNEPFCGAKLRLEELIVDHESGMEKLLALCETPQRAVDCFPALFRSKITSGNYLMAAGESLAHLNCLRGRGQIERKADSDGVDWYRRV